MSSGDPSIMVEKRDKVELRWPAKKYQEATAKDSSRDPGVIEIVEEYPGQLGYDGIEGNELFWGDNIDVLRYLLARGGKPVDMIYIDPPYFSGGNFFVRAPGHKFPRAYKDTWHDGLAQYLDYMHQRLVLMHALLRDGGSMYVHLDWHVFHYIKVMLDEIFGYENFRNQIIWKRLTYKQTQVKAYGVLHDVILFYTKGKDYTWNDVRAGYGEERLRKYFCWLETPDGRNIKLTREQLDGGSPIPEGRRFALNPVINPNPNRPNLTYEFLGFTKVWKYTREKMKGLHAQGMIFQPSPGALPQKKQYLDESAGMKLNDLFLDIGGVMGSSLERLEYDTQKPLKLLDRLIQVSTNPGDTVADFFSGSGTTLDAAARAGRRWIGCELARPGINATRKRLLASRIPHGQGRKNLCADKDVLAPFMINRVKHPVEIAWHGNARVHVQAILALHGAVAKPATGLDLGEKDGKIVAIMPHGTPATALEAGEMLEKVTRALPGSNRVDILADAWILGFDEPPFMNTPGGIEARFIQIPPASDVAALLVGTGLCLEEIGHQKVPAGIQSLIQFHVLPGARLEYHVRGKAVTLALDRYQIHDGRPGDVAEARVKSGNGTGAIDSFDVLEFIGIDWDYDGTRFRCGDASVKSRKDMPVQREFSHEYGTGGSHVIMVRMIDAFGHDSFRRAVVDISS